MEPLSKEFLIKQGSCCGTGCSNCPYIPSHKKGTKVVFKMPTKVECFPTCCSVDVMQSGKCVCALEFNNVMY